MKWTADRIVESLSKRFPSPAFALLTQVRNGTGFARKSTRTADAVAMSLWPSRGVYLTGIEIKVTLGDWRKELAEPEKSESIQRFCRHWYVAAPKGVVPAGEVPPKWGLLEIDGRGTRETKSAPALDAQPPDWLMVASIVRNAASSMVTQAELARRLDDVEKCDAETHAKAKEARRLERELEDMRLSIQRFEESSGVKIRQWDEPRIGRAVKAVLSCGADGAIASAKRLRAEAKRIVAGLDEVLIDP